MDYTQTLDSMIQASYLGNLTELAELWGTMGLSREEIDTRMNTVRTKISDITTEMVECDRENKMKIEEACNNNKKDIRVLWRKLKQPGEPEQLPSGLTLLEQLKALKLQLTSLEEKRNEIMGQFRSLIDEERAVASKLGLDAVYIDEDTIPEKNDMIRVEDNLRKMIRVKEERETHMFTMKEQIVTLLDTLGMDLNATTLSNVLDGYDEFDSLKLSDLRSVQHTMEELKTTLDQKKEEVKNLMSDITNLYSRLGISATQQCPLSTGQVCGVEELIREDNLNQLKEEKLKLEIMKNENMKIIVDNAKSELSELWSLCMVGQKEQDLFLGGLVEDTDETLTDVESEISRLGRYHAMHKETLQKMATFIDLCDLAQDLKERMQDPKRLFKNRGKTMVQEEQDRKKVNSIPRKKEELLALAEHKGNLIVFDESLSTMVEDYAQLYEELFPPPPTRAKTQQSNSLSSTRSGNSFSRTNSLRSNKTASPRSTKKLGRYHTSPAARRNTSRVMRTTPLSAQQSSSGRPNRVTGTSPLARPNWRMKRANTTLGTSRSNTNVSRIVQMAPAIHVNDGTINESVFSNNVPYNSTVCNETSISSSMVPDITMDDMENTVVLSGLINRLVAVRDAAVMQDKTLTQNTEILSSEWQMTRNHPVLNKIPRQAAGVKLPPARDTRKLRRSNSCSEIVMMSRRQGEQRRRLGSRVEDQENLPVIRESTVGRPSMVRSNSCLTASGSKRGQVVGGRLSRVGSSSNLVLR